jgi:predicted ATPase
MTLGITSYHLGELLSARSHFEEGIAGYTPVQRCSPLFRVGADPGVGCHSFAALTLWSLGYPDQALARVQDALALAPELAHPYSTAFALFFAAHVYQFRREGQEVSDHADAAMTLSTEQRFAAYLAQGTILRGWALTTQGQGEEGLRQMRHGLTAWRASGAEMLVPYYLSLLAEGYARLGQGEAGLAVLQEGWEVMERTGEHVWHAEMCRLKGTLLLQQQGQIQAEAEACFQQAIEIAQQQQAKSWELRTATNLARLWQHQGKTAEAKDLLSPVYEWFTEGFDTADLQDAKALLAELS